MEYNRNSSVLTRVFTLVSGLALTGLTACSPGAPAAPGDAAPEVFDAPPPPPPAEPAPPFDAEVRSLELKRSIAVRMTPAERAERYGTIAAGIRVGWKQVLKNADCAKRWVEIEPYGWICETYLQPSRRRPYGVEMPRLAPEEVVPGTYGKVRAEGPSTYKQDGGAMVQARGLSGSTMVRKYGEITARAHDDPTAEDQSYWLIDKRTREYVPAAHIREHRPSSWHGIRLGDDTGLSLPIGFPLSRKDVSQSVPIYRDARGLSQAGTVRGRQPLAVLETAMSDAGKPIAYRIGDQRWIRARDMRVATPAEPPPTTGPVERWIDIDLDEQILVAYEGDLPVYVTLVSTGSRDHLTPTGVHRIWVKFSETDMSDLGAESPYSVATVPWTQFYAKDMALHTAYWHDTFGTQRSHGCTNLSPVDARYLYFWSEPAVPAGWTMAKGTIERPGTVVRIRSSEDPAPAFMGYAARIHAARLSRIEPAIPE